MGALYLFTWNLKGKLNAYDRALQHLTRKAQSDLFVACIQEAPGDVEILAARQSKPDQVTLRALKELAAKQIAVVQKLPGDPLPRGLALVHHRDLLVEESVYDEDEEFIAAVFRVRGQSKRIAVIGLHGTSGATLKKREEFGASRALLRHAINTCEFLWNCDHVVVLGDWNSASSSHEISSWHCFYAISGESMPLDEASKQRRRGLGHKPLYIVRPQNTREDGTFRHKDDGDNRVLLFDFIAVGQASAPYAQANILTHIMSAPVWDPSDSDKNLSDHRPVEGHLDI